MPSVGVVIAAGGQGKRLGGRTPKQFRLLRGVPILQYAFGVFASLRQVDEIVIACPVADIRRTGRLLALAGCNKILSIVPGGKERQDSVRNGLCAFMSRPDIVLVHDAVRPFVDARIVNAVIESASKHGAAVVGVKVQDTIKVEGKKGFYSKTMDRSKLWAVQTPQAFSYDILMRAHKRARSSGYLGTDEASLVERLGVPVRIVEGDPMNMKITTPNDLRLAEMWLKEGRNRHQKT